MGLVTYQENDENVAPAAETDPLQENDPWQNQQSQQQQPQLQPQPASELELVPAVLNEMNQLVMPTVMPMPTTTEVNVENGVSSDSPWSLYGNSAASAPTPGMATAALPAPYGPTQPHTPTMSPITGAALPCSPTPPLPRPPSPTGQGVPYPAFPCLTSGFMPRPSHPLQSPLLPPPLRQHGAPRSSFTDVMQSMGQQRSTGLNATTNSEHAFNPFAFAAAPRPSHPLSPPSASRPPGPSTPGAMTASALSMISAMAQARQRMEEERQQRRQQSSEQPAQATPTIPEEIPVPDTPEHETEVAPDPAPDLCCICMSDPATHRLEPCGHTGFCGTCAMLLCAGAVVEGRSFCPLCRVPVDDYTEVQSPLAQPASAPPLTETSGGTAAARDGQVANLATSPDVEMQVAVTTTVPSDVLSILRQSASRPSAFASDRQRTMSLLRQLHELRQSPQRQQQQEAQQQQRIWHQHFAQQDYAWEDDPEGEPLILPDTGAKDGLCGERWAVHAGRWAQARGHKATVFPLDKPKTVHGVGENAQVTREGITAPVGMEDTDGKKHLCAYRAAIIRGSDVPALLGIDALRRMDAVIRCRTGEMWFLGEKGCDITPKGKHVHLQMRKGKSGHWYLPVGRFSDAMEKMAVGHLVTNTASDSSAAAKATTTVTTATTTTSSSSAQ